MLNQIAVPKFLSDVFEEKGAWKGGYLLSNLFCHLKWTLELQNFSNESFPDIYDNCLIFYFVQKAIYLAE